MLWNTCWQGRAPHSSSPSGLGGKTRILNNIRIATVESGWDRSSQDVSRGSISSSLQVRDCSTLWLLINLSGLYPCRQGGSGAGSQPDSEPVKASCSSWLGLASPLWSGGWTQRQSSGFLFVCTAAKTAWLSTVSANILVLANTCMCVGRFSDNKECGELRGRRTPYV